MRGIKKCALALRILGIVLIFIALVLSIYALAGNNEWNSFTEKANSVGLPTGISARTAFNHDYYLALSDAASDKDSSASARQAAIRKYFLHYGDEEKASAAKAITEQAAQQLTDLSASFSTEDFTVRYEKRESNIEQQQINSLLAEFDEITAPKAGSGKKMTLKNPNQVSASDYFGAYYASLPEGQATYEEFLTVVRRMMQKDQDQGIAITSLETWMNSSFDNETWLSMLEEYRLEEKAEAADNLLDTVFAEVSALPEGSSPDWDSLISTGYQNYVADHPDTVYSEDEFTSAVTGLMNNVAFAGTWDEITAEMKKAASDREKNSIANWLPELTERIVNDADARSTIGIVNVFWWMTANTVWFWVIGIVLLILAAVIEKVLSAVLVKKLSSDEFRIDTEEDELLRVSHLKQYFRSGSYVNKAVDDVSFSIRKGEVFGLVGESGCGKTTTGRTIINLYDPTEGDVYFQGLRVSATQNGLPVLTFQLKNEAAEKIRNLKEDLKDRIKKDPASKKQLTEECKEKIKEVRKELSSAIEQAQIHSLESSAEKSQCVRKYREMRQAKLTAAFEAEKASLSGEALAERQRKYEVEMKVAAKDNIMTRMQMVFQDPIASINPRMTVREIIAEGLKIRGVTDKEYIDQKVYEMLELVGLVREHADRYPHEFSGGQRQRIGIARAIVMEPDLIIADEPISALDVSIQAQVINLMNDLRERMGLTIMFIAHNLSVVKYFSDRIGVMYYGHIVEMTTSEELFAHPLHPYTKSLLSAIPYPDPHHEKVRKRIEYNPTTAHDYSQQQPTLREIVPGHFILCNDAEFEQYKKELGI